MMFKHRYDFRLNAPILNAKGVVLAIVADADGSGELERLRDQIDRLTNIVSIMAAQLPLHALKELTNTYGWDEVKEEKQ